jgi:hypothetical protein
MRIVKTVILALSLLVSLKATAQTYSTAQAFILKAGNCISYVSGSPQYGQLCMQTDGNLVVYREGTALSATSYFPSGDAPGFVGPTSGMTCAACFAAWQNDGNLVLYKDSTHPYWSSHTSGTGASLNFDGNAVSVLDANQVRRFSTYGIISPGSVLAAGECDASEAYLYCMQSDGNFVIYEGGRAQWATNTSGRNCAAGCSAVFQGDGNFVLYNGSSPYWSSNTGGHPNAVLDFSFVYSEQTQCGPMTVFMAIHNLSAPQNTYSFTNLTNVAPNGIINSAGTYACTL